MFLLPSQGCRILLETRACLPAPQPFTCQSSQQWQRCCFQISPLPPLIKAVVGETHLYSWWETIPPLPPRDWFSPLKQALCLKPLHPLCYAKEKMEDFQFNLGWAEGRSAIWVSIVLAEPAGTTRASPKRQLSRTERGAGIIDRQEKGGLPPFLCLSIEKENQSEGVTERRWSVGWEGEQGVEGKQPVICSPGQI